MGYNRCSSLFARRYNTSWRLGIMDSAELTTWASDNLSQLILLIGGLLAVCIAITYVKNKDSMKYKALMLLGLLFGVFMAVEAVTSYGDWMQVTSIFLHSDHPSVPRRSYRGDHRTSRDGHRLHLARRPHRGLRIRHQLPGGESRPCDSRIPHRGCRLRSSELRRVDRQNLRQAVPLHHRLYLHR